MDVRVFHNLCRHRAMRLVAECQLVFTQDIPFVEQVHENYELRYAAGADTRFSPFWGANIQHFQQCVADLVPVDERTRN